MSLRIVIASLLASLLWAQVGFAQQKRPILDALFKTLMDSQLEREKQRQLEAQKSWDHRHHRGRKSGRQAGPENVVIQNGPLKTGRPGRPGKPVVVPGRTVVTETVTLPAVVTVRTTIDEYVQQCDGLTQQLRKNANVPGVRPLLAKSLKFRNHARVLQQRCQQTDDIEYIADAYRHLDAEWRALSFEIQSVPEVQQQCATYVEKLDQQCDQFCETLAVEPQFDRHRLLQLQSQATAYIETLLDDIEVELHSTPDCENLLADGRRLQESIRHQTDFVETASYDEIVQRYGEFTDHWREYTPRLYPFQNQSIQRRLARIRSCGQEMSGVLWLPPTVDREYLGYLAGITTTEISNMFQHMTVQALVELPVGEQRQILTTARQLHTQCQQYSAGVTENVSLAKLRQRFGNIQGKWSDLSPHLDASKSTELRRCENRISRHCDEMSHMLGLIQDVDVHQTVQLAAALEGMSEHLRDELNRYQSSYRGPLKGKVNSAVKDFHNQCVSLHRRVARNQNPDKLRKHCIEMVECWNALSGVIDTMPQNGLSQQKFRKVNHSRAELFEIVAELAALLVV